MRGWGGGTGKDMENGVGWAGRRVECIFGEGRERVEEGNLSCTVRSGTWEPSVLEGVSVHYHVMCTCMGFLLCGCALYRCVEFYQYG